VLKFLLVGVEVLGKTQEEDIREDNKIDHYLV
jgi:hypothetical protein